jgi:hypothetical protein
MTRPDDGPLDGAAGEASAPLASVRMLHPIRTLVVARDLGFRQRALTVLAQLGRVAFAVGSPDDVIALVERQRADVVVIDVPACTPAIDPVIAALHAVDPRVGVVVVTDEPDPSPHAPPTIPKWGWADDLTAAVRRAYHHGSPLREEPVT